MTQSIIKNETKCWICVFKPVDLVKPSNIKKPLDSHSFSVTDSTYGVTTSLGKCKQCGFVQSIEPLDVLSFYHDLEDINYESNRKQRSLQAEYILSVIRKVKNQGRLLDIGAGSGILVEQALKYGYHAEGVEPSKWFHAKAVEHNIPVKCGVFPHQELLGKYEVITLIDVIEHVNNPVELLTFIRQ